MDMSFDEILDATGRFGWYQWRTYFFVCVPMLVGGALTFTQVFIGGTGEFWCKGNTFAMDDCSEWKTESECKDIKEMAACMNYNFTFQETEEELEEYSRSMSCDQGWQFDHSVYSSTITEEWGLVCDNYIVGTILQSVYFCGFLVGCLVIGAMTDRFGRRFTYLFCLVSTTGFTILSALSPNVIIFAVLRFCLAVSTYGFWLVVFVLATEMVMPSKRVYVGNLIWIWIGVSYFFLSGIAKLSTSWRISIVVVLVPYVMIIPAFLYMDESARWLITKGRYKDADKIIKKIAGTNNRPDPPSCCKTGPELDEEPEGASILDIFRNRVLFLYLLNLFYNWFVQSFVYFGLSLGTSSLGVDVYIAFCISGAVEIPAYIFSVFTMNYLGRRVATASLMFVAGLACFVTILFEPGPIRVAVAMVGKFAISASFANIYVHTAEIFPTPIRGLSVGTCSVAARAGAIVAPLVLVFGKVWEPLPLMLFAFSSVIASLLVFFLPETKGKPMPDAIGDALRLTKRDMYYPEAEGRSPDETET